MRFCTGGTNTRATNKMKKRKIKSMVLATIRPIRLNTAFLAALLLHGSGI